jgi:hypothetical protein
MKRRFFLMGVDERTLTLQRTPDLPLTLPAGDCSIEFSPDSRYVATFSSHAGQVWECQTGKLIYRSLFESQVSLKFINESTILDSSQIIVDLDKNMGESVREWNVGKDFFHLLDGDHGFVATSGKISLINYTEKVTLWTFNCWSIKARSSAPILSQSQLGIDRDAGRVVFTWSDNENAVVSSISLEGDDYREEARGTTTILKGYGGGRFKLPSIVVLSRNGKSALIYNSGFSVYNARLVSIGSKKMVKLDEVNREPVFDNAGPIVNDLKFAKEGNIEFLRQQKDKIVTLLLDSNTGKVKERVFIPDCEIFGSSTVTYSPDRKIVAFIRSANKKELFFRSISLYNSSTGKILYNLDDSAKTILIGQREEDLYQRRKAARVAAEAAIYAESEARRSLYEKESEEDKKREEEARQKFIASTRPCVRCDGKGSYEAIGDIVSYVGDGYSESRVSPFSGNLVYQTPIYRRVSKRGKVSYGCPSCRGKGRVPR